MARFRVPPRRWLLASALLAALLLGVDTLAWYWAEQRLRAGVAAWAETAQVRGWSAHWSEPESGGWPFAATLTLPDTRLSGGEAALPGGLDWQPGRLTLRVGFMHPRTLAVIAGREGRLRMAALPALHYTDRALYARLRLDTPAAGADIVANKLHLGQAGAPQGAVTVRRASLHIDPGPQPRLTLTASTLALPPPPAGQSWPLGDAITQLDADATLSGAVPSTGGFAARAASWRDSGGSLAVSRLGLAWGDFTVASSARIGLDAQLQPVAAVTARMSGYDAAVDALRDGGMMAAGPATAIKAVLGLMAQISPEGGAPVVELPLTVQDGLLTAGRIPLARLPTLRWPAG
jgi:hypothetical protein